MRENLRRRFQRTWEPAIDVRVTEKNAAEVVCILNITQDYVGNHWTIERVGVERHGTQQYYMITAFHDRDVYIHLPPQAIGGFKAGRQGLKSVP